MGSTNAAFRILALEGGGSLAMNYLPILAHIERDHFNRACLRDTGAFQMFMGTSTGAIVAAALAAGAPVEAVTAMYREELRTIFRKTRWWNRPLFYLFDSEQLNAVLRRRFREYSGGHDLTWADLSRNLKGRVELVVTLWKESHGEIKFLTTDLDNRHPYHERQLHGALVADVITACCSAPYYFSPRAFYHTPEGGGEQHLGTYCDGGITGLNNPGVLGISLAWRKAMLSPRPPGVPDLRNGDGEIQLVSMGTGYRAVNIPPHRRARWWVMDTASHTISDLMAASASLMHQFHGAFGERLAFTKYLRTDQPIEEDAGLDEIDPVRLAGYEGNFANGNVTYYFASFGGADPRPPQNGSLTPQSIAGVLADDLGIPRQTAPPAPPVEPPAAAPATVRSDEVRARLRRRLLWSGLAFAFIPLFVVVLIQLGITLSQRNELSARNKVIGEQVDQLTDRNETITRQREEIKKEANKLLTAEIATYEAPLTLLAWFLTPARAGDGAPFQDKAENIRRCDGFSGYLDYEARVAANGFVAGDLLLEHHQKFRKQLRAWEDANRRAASPPPPELVREARLLALRMTDAATATILPRARDDKDITPATELARADRVFYRKRLLAYEAVRGAVSELAGANSLADLSVLLAHQKFWEMYWGGLLLYESPTVVKMMVQLGGWRTDAGLRTWAEAGMKAPVFAAAANWDREAVRRVMREAIDAKQNAIDLPATFNAQDFLVYLDHHIEVIRDLVETDK